MPYLYGAGAYGYASPYYGAYSYPSAYYGAAYASPYYGAYSSYYSPYSYAGYGYGYGGLYGRGYYSPSQPKDDCQAMAAELIRGDMGPEPAAPPHFVAPRGGAERLYPLGSHSFLVGTVCTTERRTRGGVQ
jgi:hypothetical protein